MEMTIDSQDSGQESSAATPVAEKSSESLHLLKFGLPTDEELPMLAQLCNAEGLKLANVPPESAEAQKTLEKLVRLRERIQVARANGQVLGFVTVEPDGPVRGAAYLRHLIVKAEFRRQGVGSSLLKHAHSMASNMSRKSLILRVDPSNENVVTFVRKAGFMTVGALNSKKSGKLKLLMSHEL